MKKNTVSYQAINSFEAFKIADATTVKGGEERDFIIITDDSVG